MMSTPARRWRPLGSRTRRGPLCPGRCSRLLTVEDRVDVFLARRDTPRHGVLQEGFASARRQGPLRRAQEDEEFGLVKGSVHELLEQRLLRHASAPLHPDPSLERVQLLLVRAETFTVVVALTDKRIPSMPTILPPLPGPDAAGVPQMIFQSFRTSSRFGWPISSSS